MAIDLNAWHHALHRVTGDMAIRFNPGDPGRPRALGQGAARDRGADGNRARQAERGARITRPSVMGRGFLCAHRWMTELISAARQRGVVDRWRSDPRWLALDIRSGVHQDCESAGTYQMPSQMPSRKSPPIQIR